MSMQQAPQRRRSPWVRYAPIIVIVVIVAIVAVYLGTRSSSKKSDNNNSTTNTTVNAKSGVNGVPLFYNDAKAQGVLTKYTWQPNCDTSTGLVAVPIVNPAPCVPTAANNGGATSPGVTGSTIKIGIYIAKPDPTYDPILKAVGAYDTPDATWQAEQDYAQIFENTYEMYGRKFQLVRIDGSGPSTDAVHARADADVAAQDGVFAVIGGPAQTKTFGDELAAKHILLVGSGSNAQPQQNFENESPYLWSTGPSPEQTSSMIAHFIQTQLIGKPAQYGGADVNGKPRTFTLLTYDTPDGVYKSSWDDLENKIKGIGGTVKDHIDYFLDPTALQQDARTTAARLKAAGATSIIFTGDPIFPQFLTKEMAKDNYFPEWIMSGTVLADTNVFARGFDQQEWQHAFGLSLTPVQLPKDKQDSYTVHQWWFGTPPPTQNNYAIVKGDWQLLSQGIQLAGPNLTPQTFKNGQDAMPPVTSSLQPTNQAISTYGDHGYWPNETDDPMGLDNTGILYWDPNVSGPDETGTVGQGMYRRVLNADRFLLGPNGGNWPANIPLFNPANTITTYTDSNVPADLLPKTYPVPANAPNPNKGG
jgi:hypothetical protein